MIMMIINEFFKKNGGGSIVDILGDSPRRQRQKGAVKM